MHTICGLVGFLFLVGPPNYNHFALQTENVVQTTNKSKYSDYDNSFWLILSEVLLIFFNVCICYDIKEGNTEIKTNSIEFFLDGIGIFSNTFLSLMITMMIIL